MNQVRAPAAAGTGTALAEVVQLGKARSGVAAACRDDGPAGQIERRAQSSGHPDEVTVRGLFGPWSQQKERLQPGWSALPLAASYWIDDVAR